jgi:hypothetical protein
MKVVTILNATVQVTWLVILTSYLSKWEQKEVIRFLRLRNSSQVLNFVVRDGKKQLSCSKAIMRHSVFVTINTNNKTKQIGDVASVARFTFVSFTCRLSRLRTLAWVRWFTVRNTITSEIFRDSTLIHTKTVKPHTTYSNVRMESFHWWNY